MPLPFRLELRPPFLIVRFDDEQRTLGWSLTKPGFGAARDVVWLEVRDADLGPHVDPVDFVRTKLSAQGLDNAAAFMTAREIDRHHVAQSRVGAAVVTYVTTVGLTNGEKVRERRLSRDRVAGMINTLVHVSHALSPGAFVESIAIATLPRTAAIMTGCAGANGYCAPRRRLEALDEVSEAFAVARDGKGLVRRAQMHVETILGHINTDAAREARLVHDPSLRMRARLALATVRAFGQSDASRAMLTCGLIGPEEDRAGLRP